MEKNILVALDDSENAMKAVESLANTFTPDHKVTLFSVVQDTVAICEMYSPELSPHFLTEKRDFCSLDHMKKDLIAKAQQKAKEILMQAGFEEGNIQSKVENSKRGVARDIINESKSGYGTVVLGRRGLSGVQEFFLGSVSNKVINSVKNVSVLVVE